MLTYKFLKLNKKLSVSNVIKIVLGIGKSRSSYICYSFGFKFYLSSFYINLYFFKMLNSFLRKYFYIETKLYRFKKKNLNRFRKLNIYKGVRLTESLPLRGQRTSSNARTRKYSNIV